MNGDGRATHPMLQLHRPVIRTLPIQRCAEHFNSQIESNEHGTDVFGDGRVGKDYGVRYLLNNLGWTPHKANHCSLLFPQTTQPGDGYFFNSCLLGTNHRFIKSSPGNYSQKRFASSLLERMETEGTQLLLFRISEANRMTNEHWDHLITLDNDLDQAGIRFFLISLHQADATSGGPEAIDYQSLPQIRGRFRLDRHTFTGLLWERPKSDLLRKKPSDLDQLCDAELALREYHEYLIWPHGSGITFTQHFAPKAFANKWRLYKQRI